MSEKKEWIDLKENVETTIYEGILKLGYSHDESFSIYYDLDLLNHLLHTDFQNVEDMDNYLHGFSEYMNTKVPGFSCALLINKRFKFTVLKDGILKIKDSNKDNFFLRDMIELVNKQIFTIEDVVNVFKKSGESFVFEHADHPEFKHVLYFKDKSIDNFKYCFNFDELGSYYHRLLDFSYEQSLEEDHHH